jgi:hypothetical protein
MYDECRCTVRPRPGPNQLSSWARRRERCRAGRATAPHTTVSRRCAFDTVTVHPRRADVLGWRRDACVCRQTAADGCLSRMPRSRMLPEIAHIIMSTARLADRRSCQTVCPGPRADGVIGDPKKVRNQAVNVMPAYMKHLFRFQQRNQPVTAARPWQVPGLNPR